MEDINTTTTYSPVFEGSLDAANKAASLLKNAGISNKVHIADDSQPGSWSCCYVLAVASEDLETAKNILAGKRSEKIRTAQQLEAAAKAKARQKAKRAAKARKKNRRK